MQPIAKYTLTAVTHCEVDGVPYAPDETIYTDSKHSADYLVAQGAAVHSGGVVEAPAEEPVQQTRTTRSK